MGRDRVVAPHTRLYGRDTDAEEALLRACAAAERLAGEWRLFRS